MEVDNTIEVPADQLVEGQEENPVQAQMDELKAKLDEQEKFNTKLSQEKAAIEKILIERQPQQQVVVPQVDVVAEKQAALLKRYEDGLISSDELAVENTKMLGDISNRATQQAMAAIQLQQQQTAAISNADNSIFSDGVFEGFTDILAPQAEAIMQNALNAGHTADMAAQLTKGQLMARLGELKARFKPTEEPKNGKTEPNSLKGEGEKSSPVKKKEKVVTQQSSQQDFINMRRSKAVKNMGF